MFPKWEHNLVEVSSMDFLIFMVLVLVLLPLMKAFIALPVIISAWLFTWMILSEWS
jgi:hypothetical protein